MSIFTYLINDVTQNMLFTNTRHTQKVAQTERWLNFEGKEKAKTSKKVGKIFAFKHRL